MTGRDRAGRKVVDPELPGGPPQLGDIGPVEVRRSKRRTSTVSAFRERGQIVVLIPAKFTVAQEKRWVADVVTQLLDREHRRARTAEQLFARAQELNAEYFAGQLRPSAVTWSSQQRRVWGTCNTDTGSIRLAATLQQFPVWVQDYVLMHELAHLVEPRHCPRFWAIVEQFPHTERARGFLEGVSAAAEQLSDADLAQWAFGVEESSVVGATGRGGRAQAACSAGSGDGFGGGSHVSRARSGRGLRGSR